MAPRAAHPTSQTPCSLENWIRLIREACSRDADSVLELARLMSQARQILPYGGWSRLWQSSALPFSKRKGEMLVAIGHGVGELDAQNSAQLPSAWNTLYYLARLGRMVVEQLIKQGRIHPGLSLQGAKALLVEFHPATLRTSPHSKLKNRLARFSAFVRADMGIWSPTERELVNHQLAALMGEIQAASKLAKSDEAKIPCLNSSAFTPAASPNLNPRASRPHSTQIIRL